MKTTTFWLLVLILLSGCMAPGSSACRPNGALPDRNCTPGVPNPDVTQANIQQTICVQGWTATIRPPQAYTDALKQKGIGDYGYEDQRLADYEEDHLIPLELGGDPRDPANLWPEPRRSIATPGAEDKDKVENYLRGQVCAGHLSLVDAQSGISADWTQFLAAVSTGIESVDPTDPDDQ